MADAVAEEYKSSLADLNFNSKPHINMLTMLAEDNIKYAPQIVQAIADHIQSVPAEVKLPGLYLVDSIIKNVGKQYLTLFSQNLVTLFSCVFEKVEENTRSLLYKLRQTWNDILPNKILYAVDVRVKKLDPAWPVTAQPPAQSIHINPKFLGSNTQNSSDDIAVVVKKEEDRLKQQQSEVLKQLLAKQEQLRQLEQKNKEIANRKKLIERSTVQSIAAIRPPAVDPRAVAKLNPKLSHRDPRLQKINAVSVPLSKLTENLSVKNTKFTPSAASIPSVAVVPNLNKSPSISVPESQTLKENNFKSEKNISDVKDSVKNIPLPPKTNVASPKKSSPKNVEQPIQSAKNSPLEKSKTSKSHTSSIKSKGDESAKKKSQDHKSVVSNEVEKSPKHDKSHKDVEKSPRTPKKKSVSPEEKDKTSRSSRSSSKSDASKTTSFRQRSRSPVHKPEKSKSEVTQENVKYNSRNRENGHETSEAKVPETALRDQTGKGRGKRESSVSNEEDSKENEIGPPEKRLRNDTLDDHSSSRSQDSHSLFGKEDQDYRHLSKGQNETNHKGWAQYKASHPDEFKSPLRPARENMENKDSSFAGKMKTRPFERLNSNDGFYPVECDRLGRPRLHRGRSDQRFPDRRGFYTRGPGNRFNSSFQPLDQQFKDPLASMMLTDPQTILQQAELKFRLGRIPESDYIDLRRDLEIMLQSEEYRRLRDQTYRMQRPERFGMGNQNEFENRQIRMPNVEPFPQGEPLKIQGPMMPPPEVRSFKLDNKMRTIHFVEDKALVIMDNDEPRELTFKGEPRNVFIEGLPDPILLGFDGQSVEFEVDGKRHIMRFGAPSREIYINNHPYEAKFGGPPFAAMLEDGRVYRIRLGGPPPQVVVDDKPQYELLSKFHAKNAAPPFKPLDVDLCGQNANRRPGQVGGNVPFDVDMRMAVDDGNRKPPSTFDSSRDDMKDVDWRLLPPPTSKESDGKYFEQIRRQEPWDKNVQHPVNSQNFQENANTQGPPAWHDKPPFASDRPPLLTHEWESLSPSSSFKKLNGSPRNTPPIDKEWECQKTFEPIERPNWRENEYRQNERAPPPHPQHPDQQRHMYSNQRNSPLLMENHSSQYYDGPRNIRPNQPRPMRPPFDDHRKRPHGPQYGSWIRPNFRERGPGLRPQGRDLKPPPLPPFQMKSLLGDPPRHVLLPSPSFPARDSVTEAVHEPTEATAVPVSSEASSKLSSDATQTEVADSASVPSIPPPLNIDVGTLFQKLVAAGIINSKGIEQSTAEKETTKEEEDNKKEKESSPDVEPIPPIELKLESLRLHYPGVISALYRGSQCASCGMRFKEIQSEHYSRHLDWHFRMNRREKDGVKKAFSRRWYYEVEDWNQFEEFEDFEERAPSYFELQADGSQMQTEEPVDVPSIPASGQETEVCIVCDEPFQLFWVEDEEEWHLRDAVRHEERAYHPACYEDHKKASEIPQAPPEDTTICIKQEPPEETAEEMTTDITDVSEDISIKKEEDMKSEKEGATEVTEISLDATDVKTEETDVAEVKTEIKEEPPEDILEGKPGEEEIIGLISESDMEAEAQEPKVESKMVVMQSGGGIVLKIKAESIQPQSPASPKVTEKETAASEAAQESEEEEFRPPTPDPRFQVLPPVKKGTELSGLCSIM